MSWHVHITGLGLNADTLKDQLCSKAIPGFSFIANWRWEQDGKEAKWELVCEELLLTCSSRALIMTELIFHTSITVFTASCCV